MERQSRQQLGRRHVVLGWWMIAVFALTGLILEGLLGLRVPWYVNVASETRRHMMTLGHAHGTLLGLVNVGLGLTLRSKLSAEVTRIGLTSSAIMGATVLIPSGFVLGGLVIHAGDPGLGILLVPVGALLLVLGSLNLAIGLSRTSTSQESK